MRGVSVVVVCQLGSGVQEAAVAREVAGHGGGVSWRLLALAPTGKGVELGVADVRKSGGGSGVVAGLGPARGSEGARGTGGSSAGRGSRAAGTAGNRCSSTWCSRRGAVIRVVHGGARGRSAFIVGGGSHVVVAIGGVLEREAERSFRLDIMRVSKQCPECQSVHS